MPIESSEISCPICKNYEHCRQIEEKHRSVLQANGGNWRALSVDGRREKSPIRRCSLVWTEQKLANFRNGAMLEIGCGAAREIDFEFCALRNIQYTGVDDSIPYPSTSFLPVPALQQAVVRKLCKVLGLKKMPKLNSHQQFIRDFFPTKHVDGMQFDLIYGNSTIEHWHEDNKDLEHSVLQYQSDIKRCFDLLKSRGRLLLSCPIFVHGNGIFMQGKIAMIEKIFNQPWAQVKFEYWRREHGDLMPYAPKARIEHFKKDLNIDLNNIYLINVEAVKG